MADKEWFEHIDGHKDEMVRFLTDIISIPAVGPGSGGSGEEHKAAFIQKYLRDRGFGKILRFDAPDSDMSSGFRPNIMVDIKGRSSDRRIVVITHMDVVPPGDPGAWESDPFDAQVRDGQVTGRGAEDNGQALTASIFAARALLDTGAEPAFDIALFFVSDEEETNEKGIGHLLKEGVFRDSDLILVPDHGEPEGRMIEIGEKSLLWVRVKVKGKQCHASMPHLGNNAFRASMMFGSEADRALHERFDQRDDSFDHPLSSFEPTKREPGVSGINVLPGEDVFYMDCRLLPLYDAEDVLSVMRGVADDIESRTGVRIDLEVVLNERTIHPTGPDAMIVRNLSRAIEMATGKKAYTGGIGGGTCAAMLRNAGFEVAVWETVLNQAHAPNEHILVDNMISDCKVIATLFMMGDF
ncbi:MAG: M20 family metallo-hydrolase [Candidatus Thermoplasmatota archaeon]|nr:M20 family metallo-hydrolase [Candidatus Thermoplasmatota archaeon]